MTHVGTWGGTPGNSAALNGLSCDDTPFDVKHPRPATVGPVNVQRPNIAIPAGNNFAHTGNVSSPATGPSVGGLRGSYFGADAPLNVQNRIGTPVNVQTSPNVQANAGRSFNVQSPASAQSNGVAGRLNVENYAARAPDNNFNINKPVSTGATGIENFRAVNVQRPSASAYVAANTPAAVANPVANTSLAATNNAEGARNLNIGHPVQANGGIENFRAIDTSRPQVANAAPTVNANVNANVGGRRQTANNSTANNSRADTSSNFEAFKCPVNDHLRRSDPGASRG